jgi:methylthioxylose transferase
VVLAAGALFTAAALVGRDYADSQNTLRLRWPPLYAYWGPHAGPGSVAAPAVAVLVIAYGPRLARALRWRALLFASWAGAMAWGWSLTLVDGWHRGVATRLTTGYEYLRSVGDVHDIGDTLRGFTGRILMDAPDNWPPHVAGHPPAALLTFVGLDRAGLGGGVWASVFVITVGSSAVAALLVTVRSLASEDLARGFVPYAVLTPSAVWAAVSADGYFTAVAAWALALLALAATGGVRAPAAAAVGSGLLFGLVCYLSYGLVLTGFLALAVLAAAHTKGRGDPGPTAHGARSTAVRQGRLGRAVRPVPLVLLVLCGMAPWFVWFTASGFWWFEGWSTLVERYYQGAARVRPYGYFVWANLAAQTAVAGPAVVASLRRATSCARRGVARAAPERGALLLLVAGGVCCLLAADLSGMSKGETERIWLPFTLWLLPATALLPESARRWWLAAQSVLALTVNHLLVTGW